MKAKKALFEINEQITEAQRKLNDIVGHVTAIYTRVDEMYHSTSSELYLKEYAESQQNEAIRLKRENEALMIKIERLEQEIKELRFLLQKP